MVLRFGGRSREECSNRRCARQIGQPRLVFQWQDRRGGGVQRVLFAERKYEHHRKPATRQQQLFREPLVQGEDVELRRLHRMGRLRVSK